MTDVQKAPRDLGKTALVLWCVSAGIPVLAFVIGIAVQFSPYGLPLQSSIIWIPLAIIALVFGIVALRRAGSSKGLAIAAVSLTGIGLLPVVIVISFLLLTLVRSA